MAELKTRPTGASVRDFLKSLPDEVRRKDAARVLELIRAVTGEQPRMWGKTMVGFGSYHYRYASGQEGDWPLVAFSPGRQNLTVYIMPGFAGYGGLLATLGPHKTGRSCLYLKSLETVHLPTLKELVRQSVRDMKQMLKERKGGS